MDGPDGVSVLRRHSLLAVTWNTETAVPPALRAATSARGEARRQCGRRWRMPAAPRQVGATRLGGGLARRYGAADARRRPSSRAARGGCSPRERPAADRCRRHSGARGLFRACAGVSGAVVGSLWGRVGGRAPVGRLWGPGGAAARRARCGAICPRAAASAAAAADHGTPLDGCAASTYSRRCCQSAGDARRRRGGGRRSPSPSACAADPRRWGRCPSPPPCLRCLGASADATSTVRSSHRACLSLPAGCGGCARSPAARLVRDAPCGAEGRSSGGGATRRAAVRLPVPPPPPCVAAAPTGGGRLWTAPKRRDGGGGGGGGRRAEGAAARAGRGRRRSPQESCGSRRRRWSAARGVSREFWRAEAGRLTSRFDGNIWA
ncbi:hypothetical protein BU14_0055s0012 [Porphyra umbilicalis]|uniref:Uncharacterized protein n=1 Tax=Porphyra umbilicalis TaxID=2786 RepID=A0A1X6PHE7_PORUM|nr:hypothetical protein BU14_0055s0012 [Porphyra umbilicalis]|eukprot:OSX80290.1 hypothetical protein BU14_0055s0012 [Porphyra umbilicalis]